jgi:hypothetical protein
MSRRLRHAFGSGTSIQAADATVGRGLADVLAVLDNVIDDDATLGRICTRLDENVPGAALGLGPGAAADEACARTGTSGVPGTSSTPGTHSTPRPAVAAAQASGPVRSRRRLALGSAAAVAAALAAGAVALATIGMPAAGPGGTGRPAVSTAYVVKRVDSALSAAHPGAIAQMTVTTQSAAISGGQAAPATSEEWSYGDRWRAVTYSSSGHLLYDEGSSTASADTVVSYPTRSWARGPESARPAALAPGARGCEPVAADLPLLLQPGLPAGGPEASWLPSTVAKDLRAAVSCGNLVSAGTQRVNGAEAIKLTSSPDSVIPETIWVSPGSYLPVRVVIRPAPGRPGPAQSANITWLKPTSQNLASLNVPIPAGFRRIPLAAAVRSTAQATRVWSRL